MVKDLKVLELASVLAGPSVGQFFAELGAEVIKVENLRSAGDVTRTWRVKDEKTDDRSAYFCSVNWGKKSIAIDLNRIEGKQIVYDLSRRCDILISSFKAGDAEKLRVGYETISSLNPQVIYAQITGFGPINPRVGYDAVVQAESGFMYMNGEPGGASLKMPVALMDILAAHHLKEGILLALLQRAEASRGQFLEVSLMQAAIASLANQATNWLVAGCIPQKQGSAHPNISPYGDLFRSSDGHEVLLAVGNDRQFAALQKILDLQESEVAPFQTNEQRVRNRGDLRAVLQRKIETQSLQNLTAALNEANIPFGIVKDMKQVFETPEAQEILLHSHDRIGVRTYVGRSSENLPSHFLPPPHLGEHTHEILAQTLARTPQSIKSMIEGGIVA
jgi:crotonobetainyl-CoA:carnitine CoA-transferase CaiB-like acyl-CoA transferase